MTDHTLEATRLELTHTFNAPRERVYHAWTNAEALRQWWGPVGAEIVSVESDVRVGGRYRYVLNGGKHVVTGEYSEVVLNEKLVYTWRWEGADDPTPMLVTVVFIDRGAQTELQVTHERFPNQEERDSHNQGWVSTFESLDSFLVQ